MMESSRSLYSLLTGCDGLHRLTDTEKRGFRNMPGKLSSTNKWGRWLAIMQRLPRSGRKITAEQLVQMLGEQGMRVSLRTIQRDLAEMMDYIPIESDDAKERGWRWKKESAWLVSPEADASQAVAWAMLEQLAGGLLPPAIQRSLAPFFDAATRGMTRREKAWLEKIRVVPNGFSLLPPQISPKVHDLVCEALYQGKQLEFDYKREGETPKHYREVNPLGLVQQDRELILVATHAESENKPRHFLLQRFINLRPLEQVASKPPGFSLDNYIALGGFGFGSGTSKQVELHVVHWLGIKLMETPLSLDQKIVENADGSWIVTATVPDCQAFDWWVMSMGENVIVNSE